TGGRVGRRLSFKQNPISNTTNRIFFYTKIDSSKNKRILNTIFIAILKLAINNNLTKSLDNLILM
uniref:hypothetical protein n=1 Tax=uncultured Tenacibaculum sp. TaxID=174713 RepID=UPI00261B91F9